MDAGGKEILRNSDYVQSVRHLGGARLMLEQTDAAIPVWGAHRVGLKLAPRGDPVMMDDSNPAATLGYVAQESDSRGIAPAFTREPFGGSSDLPRRFERGAPLNEPMPESFFAPGPVGYKGYLTLAIA